ncbi:hypothetical protein GCWU000341_02603 [Oribacterium sp. oral taxon 078 str. F0262]|uniref:hypothetical protein n=1 Tax=Oribacterium sp. oral taxon 078 TaxID=652706 RepID=UPI0001BCBA80|nr:hypothetical protein [Oribacterium sp. oral taxon 078]EFE90716.1 hypothetical protein GCWU000341_02603 [Oribacterium sp. oral taxon 078 str. F0262]
MGTRLKIREGKLSFQCGALRLLSEEGEKLREEEGESRQPFRRKLPLHILWKRAFSSIPELPKREGEQLRKEGECLPKTEEAGSLNESIRRKILLRMLGSIPLSSGNMQSLSSYDFEKRRMRRR